MFRKSSNGPWIGAYQGINQGYFEQLGGTSQVGQRLPGQLGATFVADNAAALLASYTSVGTLYQGVYQLVKFTSAVTRGELLFWDTLANNGMNDYEVTHTVTAATAFRAGVCLFTDSAASGKYGYIQIAGLASMLYGNSAVGTIGLDVIQATALDTPLLTVATVNTIADATSGTALTRRAFVGSAYETPAQNAVRRVWMSLGAFYVNINK